MQKRVLLGLAGLCAALLFSWSASAEYVQVNSTDDVIDNKDGKCTLREAIKLANTQGSYGGTMGECVAIGESGSPGGIHKIKIPDGTYKLTNSEMGAVYATSGTLEDYDKKNDDNEGLVGDLDIKVNLTLEAKDGATIDGDNKGRIIHVVSENAKVTLQNLVLKNGASPGGGAIYNVGTLTVKNCEIKNNTAGLQGGGAILNANSLTITDSVITGNKEDGYGGGGIKSWDGNLTISNSTIENNSALDESDGGGIYCGGNVVITDSSIINNKADSMGGGLAIAGNTTIINSLISGNEAKDNGGAIVNFDNGTLEIKNSTITKNISKKNGNVIFNEKDGVVSLIHDTLYWNLGGGGVTLVNNSSAEDFTFQNTIMFNNVPKNECEGEYDSLGGNIFGLVPNCGLQLKPTDKTYQNYMTMPMGAFKDLGKPGKGFYPLLTGAVALGAAESDKCEKKDQIDHTRKPKCDTGAIEAVCGDGITHSPDEECDDGNKINNDTCFDTCKKAPTTLKTMPSKIKKIIKLPPK